MCPTPPSPESHPLPGQNNRPVLALCLAGFSLGVALFLYPANGMAEAKQTPPKTATASQPGSDEVTRKEEGFPIPRKGPLISELREEVDSDTSRPATVIRRYEDYHGNTVREFLINGRLFQIEVTPVDGLPYYLIDVEGNGLFQERYAGARPRLVVPQWVLFRF